MHLQMIFDVAGDGVGVWVVAVVFVAVVVVVADIVFVPHIHLQYLP